MGLGRLLRWFKWLGMLRKLNVPRKEKKRFTHFKTMPRAAGKNNNKGHRSLGKKTLLSVIPALLTFYMRTTTAAGRSIYKFFSLTF